MQERGCISIYGVAMDLITRQMSLRSFNPILKQHFKLASKAPHQYGFRSINSPEQCQAVLDKLKLKDKYPNSEGRLDIIDIFAGQGLLSTMVNYELKPRTHLVIEHNKEHVKFWQSRLEYLKERTNNAENFVFSPLDGHLWKTFDKLLVEQKIVTPKVQPRSKVHDELLILGNVSSIRTGESLFAQWLMCIAHKNWLQKYGRVRMIITGNENTVQKFFAGPNFVKRNRTSTKRAMFSDSTLIAIAEPEASTLQGAGSLYDPRLIIKDQPYLLPNSSISPTGAELAVVEIVPKDIHDVDVNEIEFLTQAMLYRLKFPIEFSLKILAPGAADDLMPLIPKEILLKKFKQLTDEDVRLLYDVYHNWAFKPSYEDTLSLYLEDSRSF